MKKYVILTTYQDSLDLNQRLTNSSQGIWTDGITNNYCIPIKHPTLNKWAVIILDEYTNFFTQGEIDNSEEIDTSWFSTDDPI